MNLLILNGEKQGTRIPITDGLTIGRDPSNHLALLDPRASRVHCSIHRKDQIFILKDLDSSNGTFVNGNSITEKTVCEGDEILIGNTRMRMAAENGTSPEEPQVSEMPLVGESNHEKIIHSVNYKKTTYLEAQPESSDASKLQKTLKNLSILYRSGNILNHFLDEENLLEKILALVMEVMKADRYVMLVREKSGEGFSPKIMKRGPRQGYFPLVISQAIIDKVAKERLGIISSLSSHDARFQGSESIIICGIKSAMCVPIEVRNEVYGLIYLDSLVEVKGFEEDDLKLLSTIAFQTGLSLENARLYRDLRDQERLRHELMIARQIQQNLWPRTFPSITGFDLYFKSLAAEEVGGDYYDWFWISDSRLALVIADVSGKGVPGALVASMFRATLKSRALNALTSALLLKEVNNLLMPDMREDMFISATLSFLDIQKRQMSFSRAGHLPLLIWRASEQRLVDLSPRGLALGFSVWNEHPMLEEMEVNLSQGDVVVFFTDGAEEARNQNSEFLGRDRFCEFIKNGITQNPKVSAKDMVQEILRNIHSYAGSVLPSDDITLGILKVL